MVSLTNSITDVPLISVSYPPSFSTYSGPSGRVPAADPSGIFVGKVAQSAARDITKMSGLSGLYMFVLVAVKTSNDFCSLWLIRDGQ